MPQLTISLFRTLLASIVLMLAGAATTASAQEYCVACTEPDSLYRCVIDGARPGAAASLQVLCISALAKEGRHATCAVKRGVGVIDCNGAIKRVAVPAEGVAPTVAAPAAEPKPEGQGGEPKTVAEMLRRAKDQNDRNWDQANAQIKANNEKAGSFFKKSWDCLASLFAKCGAN
jgi:hypothetical protein